MRAGLVHKLPTGKLLQIDQLQPSRPNDRISWEGGALETLTISV